jgi:hypothetical protein
MVSEDSTSRVIVFPVRVLTKLSIEGQPVSSAAAKSHISASRERGNAVLHLHCRGREVSMNIPRVYLAGDGL